MLRAAADPVTDERHIPYQIVVSWNANSMACTSPCLLLSAAVVATGFGLESFAAGFGLESSICGTAEAEAGPLLDHS